MMGSQYIGSEKKFVKCQVSKFPIYLGQIVQGLKRSDLGHQIDDDEEYLDVSDEQDKNKENSDFVECPICGDHIMKEFLERHLKMNHDDGGMKSGGGSGTYSVFMREHARRSRRKRSNSQQSNNNVK